MRKIKQILQLNHEADLGRRGIAQSIGTSYGSVDHLSEHKGDLSLGDWLAAKWQRDFPDLPPLEALDRTHEILSS